jgi:hypothetical protein
VSLSRRPYLMPRLEGGERRAKSRVDRAELGHPWPQGTPRLSPIRQRGVGSAPLIHMTLGARLAKFSTAGSDPAASSPG